MGIIDKLKNIVKPKKEEKPSSSPTPTQPPIQYTKGTTSPIGASGSVGTISNSSISPSTSTGQTQKTGQYVPGRGFVTSEGQVYATTNPNWTPSGYVSTTEKTAYIGAGGKVYGSEGTQYIGEAVVPGTGGKTANILKAQTISQVSSLLKVSPSESGKIIGQIGLPVNYLSTGPTQKTSGYSTIGMSYEKIDAPLSFKIESVSENLKIARLNYGEQPEPPKQNKPYYSELTSSVFLNPNALLSKFQGVSGTIKNVGYATKTFFTQDKPLSLAETFKPLEYSSRLESERIVKNPFFNMRGTSMPGVSSSYLAKKGDIEEYSKSITTQIKPIVEDNKIVGTSSYTKSYYGDIYERQLSSEKLAEGIKTTGKIGLGLSIPATLFPMALTQSYPKITQSILNKNLSTSERLISFGTGALDIGLGLAGVKYSGWKAGEEITSARAETVFNLAKKKPFVQVYEETAKGVRSISIRGIETGNAKYYQKIFSLTKDKTLKGKTIYPTDSIQGSQLKVFDFNKEVWKEAGDITFSTSQMNLVKELGKVSKFTGKQTEGTLLKYFQTPKSLKVDLLPEGLKLRDTKVVAESISNEGLAISRGGKFGGFYYKKSAGINKDLLKTPFLKDIGRTNLQFEEKVRYGMKAEDPVVFISKRKGISPKMKIDFEAGNYKDYSKGEMFGQTKQTSQLMTKIKTTPQVFPSDSSQIKETIMKSSNIASLTKTQKTLITFSNIKNIEKSKSGGIVLDTKSKDYPIPSYASLNKQILLSSTSESSKQRNLMITLPSVISKSVSINEQKNKLLSISMIKQVSLNAVQTKDIRTNIPSFGKYTPKPTTETITPKLEIPIIFPPKFKMDFDFSFGARKIGASARRKYTPSYSALIFNIRGKAPKGTYMGQLRPITRGFSWAFTNKKIGIPKIKNIMENKIQKWFRG